MQNRTKRAAAMLTAAALLPAVLLTGCYKGDGTEVRVRKSAKLTENSYAEELDAAFSDVTVDENAKTDYPFSFDINALETPAQDILMIQIYEYADAYVHTQRVNYYDRSGNVYYYRQPVDTNEEFYSVLYAHWSADATVVNIMGDADRNTLWYFANRADDCAEMQMKEQDPGKDIYGTTWLYLVDESGTPVLLGQYGDVCMYRDSDEVTAFLNWFSFFYHSDFVFGS